MSALILKTYQQAGINWKVELRQYSSSMDFAIIAISTANTTRWLEIDLYMKFYDIVVFSRARNAGAPDIVITWAEQALEDLKVLRALEGR